MNQNLETERLLLSQFMTEDIPSMIKNWISQEDVQRNYGEPTYTKKGEIKSLFSKWKKEASRYGKIKWSISLKENGESIGMIGFCDVDKKNSVIDIEYCIGKEFQGNGYVTEAIRAIIEYTFMYLGYNRIQAFHRGRNSISGKVLEKAGFVKEGIHRKAFRYIDSNEFDDKVWYSILREEYKGLGSV